MPYKTKLPVMAGLALILMTAGLAAAAPIPPEVSELQKVPRGYSATATWKLDASPGGQLVTEKLVGDISLQAEGNNQLEIVEKLIFKVGAREEAEKKLRKLHAVVTQSGDRIDISAPKKGYDHTRTSYQIKVPLEFNVNASTAGGDVELSSLKGNASLTTSGGDVRAVDLSGNLKMKTSGGDITLENAREGTFNLETSGGDIEVIKVEGDVEARTSGGDVTFEDLNGKTHYAKTSGGDVTGKNIEGDVELNTSAGDVLASDIKGDLWANTAAGDIKVENVEGDANIRTAAGSLTIFNVSGQVTGNTSAGNIIVDVNETLKAPLKLETSAGYIKLTLPAQVKATLAIETMAKKLTEFLVQSDFELSYTEEEPGIMGRKIISAETKINGGGPLIELKTHAGGITIKKK